MAIYRAAKFVRGKLVKTCQHKHATRTHAVGCALYARNLTAQFKNLMSQTDSGITVAALRFE